jgi:hypothetical protein
VEQLPSGIPYFFAVLFFLSAVIVFFSGGDGVTPVSATLGVTFVMLGGIFVWLGGHGLDTQEANLLERTAHAEFGTKKETTAFEETTSVPRPTVQSQSASTIYANYCIEKQFAEATQGMNPQQDTDYKTGIINEAVARGVDPRTVLSERGFPC